MRKSFLSLAFLFAPIFIFSQTSLWNDSRNIWEIDARLGKYFPFEERHAYMKVLPQYGIDLRVARQTDGRAQWEKTSIIPFMALSCVTKTTTSIAFNISIAPKTVRK